MGLYILFQDVYFWGETHSHVSWIHLHAAVHAVHAVHPVRGHPIGGHPVQASFFQERLGPPPPLQGPCRIVHILSFAFCSGDRVGEDEKHRR